MMFLTLLFVGLIGVSAGKGKKDIGKPIDNLGFLTTACTSPSGEKHINLEDCVKWSIGLEHETYLVHSKPNRKEEYVVNSGTIANQLARYGRTFGLTREQHSVAVYIDKTGIEFSGRSCAGINEVNFKSMAESVTRDHKQLTFDAGFCQLSLLDEKTIEVLSLSPGEVNRIVEFGPITPPRSGMSSNIGLYTRSGGKTFACSSCDECDLKDYTGSYHISISLPHDKDGWIAYDSDILGEDLTCSSNYTRHDCDLSADEVWVKAHTNFGNMIQWVEPLILAVMGSSDSEAVCDNGEFFEGSYRTTSSGWGVPGTTDVRTFGTNVTGRYTENGFEWMMDVIPETSGLWRCVDEGMGSDIRTISDNPMTIGHGFELRIFDNFPIKHLPMAYSLVGLLAEASRLHQSEEYIYGNEAWKLSAQSVTIEGWNAILDSDYVLSLEKNLNVDLSGLDGNLQAFEVFKVLFSELLTQHSDGMWTSLLLENFDFDVKDLVSPNRLSWESGAIDADFTPGKIRETLGIESGGVVTLSDVKCTCMDDVEELVYLADTFGMVESIEMNSDGSVKSAKFKSKDLDKDVEERLCGV